VTGRNAKGTWQQNISESVGKKIVLVLPAVIGQKIRQLMVGVLKLSRPLQSRGRMAPWLYDYSAAEYQKARWRH